MRRTIRTARSTTRTTTLAALTLATALVATTDSTAWSAPQSPGGPPQPNEKAGGRHTEMGDALSLQRALSGGTASAGARKKSPEAAGLQAQLDTLVADGAVAASARVDSPTLDWAGSAGVRDRGTPRQAKPQDRFRVASNTKMMIATLVMQEVERGTWTLDSRTSEIDPRLFPGHDVTIEQLLSHLSGAPDALGNLVASRMSDVTSWPQFFRAIGADYTDAEFIAMANSLPWIEPGTQWSYSNAGYVALGVMLQKVTGSDVAALLQKRVFAPARMRHTSYAVKPGTQGPFLVGSAFTSAGTFSTANFNPRLFSSAGAVVSTTEDLNRFTDALVDGRLVSKDTVNEMMTARATSPLGYGLGLMRLPDPCTPAGASPRYLYGHNGGAYGTVSWALSSGDGTRQVSVGVTGRYFSDTDPAQPQPFDLDTALVSLIRATC
jgi:D-alanyl-D-alanine carboxypeptidase